MKITEKTPQTCLDLGQILDSVALLTPHPCIYYLLDADNEIIYVGQTVNLQSRLLEHRVSGLNFVRVRFHTCEASDLDRLEQEALSRFKPRLTQPPKATSTSGCLSKQLICLKYNITPIAFERLREAFRLYPVSVFGNTKYYKPEDVEAWVKRFKGLIVSGRYVLQAGPTYVAVGISSRTKLIQVYTKQ
ncbi:GIY-YIG nuclease family protein [Spirosoma litoris]